jgi:hypothetical protein
MLLHTHDQFLQQTTEELNPVGFLEEIVAREIAGASWRLYRCNAAEAQLGDIDPSTDNTRRSIERSRAAAMLALNRASAMFRKLQNERRKHEEAQSPAGSPGQMASNCKTAEGAPTADSGPSPQTPRNALCPCNSGLKYKRCCGINAAPVLSNAA